MTDFYIELIRTIQFILNTAAYTSSADNIRRMRNSIAELQLLVIQALEEGDS